MKILIASDIHGSSYYASALLERFKEEGAERLVLLGDLLYHGPRNDLPRDYAPKSVIEILNSISDKIINVRGNCDTEVDQMVLCFPIMAEYSVLLLDGRSIYLTHGHHLEELKTKLSGNNTVIFFGHTHVPTVTNEGNITLINPGSVSIPKEGSCNSYIILENKTVLLKDVTSGEIYKKYELR